MFKRHFKEIVLAITAIFIMTGCAPQKVNIQALKPAEVAEMSDKKKVAVVRFQNDRLGLSKKVEVELSRKKVDKKKYFTVVNRNALNRILKEQKLQHSDISDGTNAAKIGKLAGAEVIITGHVTSDARSDRYKVDKEKCLSWYKTGGCAKWRYYRVTCRTTNADVTGTFNIVDVEKGTTVYAEDIMKTYQADSCKDKKVLSSSQAKGQLAQSIAKEFVDKLAPGYVHFNVALMESLDGNTTSMQEEKFKNSLKYIQNGRIKKAQRLLQDLDEEFQGGNYVVAYNIALTYEALGKNKDALRHYILADELSDKPHKYIDAGLSRVEKNIVAAIEAKYQMKK